MIRWTGLAPWEFKFSFGAGAIHNPLNNSLVSSYDGLRELVDLMFPPVVEERDEPTSEEVSLTSRLESNEEAEVKEEVRAHAPPREKRTHTTVKARFWPWLSGRGLTPLC